MSLPRIQGDVPLSLDPFVTTITRDQLAPITKKKTRHPRAHWADDLLSANGAPWPINIRNPQPQLAHGHPIRLFDDLSAAGLEVMHLLLFRFAITQCKKGLASDWLLNSSPLLSERTGGRGSVSNLERERKGGISPIPLSVREGQGGWLRANAGLSRFQVKVMHVSSDMIRIRTVQLPFQIVIRHAG